MCLFLDLKEIVFFNFVFILIFLLTKIILLRFLQNFVDLDELILNKHILLGFDKIFKTIF